MTAATIVVTCMALTKASFAGPSRNRPAAPSWAATACVPAIDPPAAPLAAAGRAASFGLSAWWYDCARIEPSTATPSATPTWRAVLVSAEPAPARSRGSTSMTAEVAAGMVTPMPAPCTKNSRPSSQAGDAVPSST